MQRTLPQRTDGLAEPFFQGCREGVLRLQFCADCHTWQFYPRSVCVSCGGTPVWKDADGSGSIASYTVVRRAVSSAYEAPYVVALVDLSEGPRLMASIVDCRPEAVAVGADVFVAFDKWSDTITLPVFRLIQQEI